MVLTADQERLKNLLIETITLLCKNGLDFQSEFSVDALIGITLDQKDVFLVTIKETVKSVVNNEMGKEQFSHADTSDADFHENNHHQKSLNCQIGFDIVSAATNDDFGSKLAPESSVSQGRKGRSCVGKTFCGSISPSTSDNCLPVVNVASPLSDDDICILENIIPSVSSQKSCAVMDSLQLEPPRKRQREISCSLKNSSAVSQEAVIQDLISPCKLEPLEYIKLENSPVVPEHFGTQDSHSFLYNTAYCNEVSATLDPLCLNWYSPPNPVVNPPAVPGCSSWLNSSSVFASRNLQNHVSII